MVARNTGLYEINSKTRFSCKYATNTLADDPRWVPNDLENSLPLVGVLFDHIADSRSTSPSCTAANDLHLAYFLFTAVARLIERLHLSNTTSGLISNIHKFPRRPSPAAGELTTALASESSGEVTHATYLQDDGHSQHVHTADDDSHDRRGRQIHVEERQRQCNLTPTTGHRTKCLLPLNIQTPVGSTKTGSKERLGPAHKNLWAGLANWDLDLDEAKEADTSTSMSTPIAVLASCNSSPKTTKKRTGPETPLTLPRATIKPGKRERKEMRTRGEYAGRRPRTSIPQEQINKYPRSGKKGSPFCRSRPGRGPQISEVPEMNIQEHVWTAPNNTGASETRVDDEPALEFEVPEQETNGAFAAAEVMSTPSQQPSPSTSLLEKFVTFFNKSHGINATNQQFVPQHHDESQTCHRTNSSDTMRQIAPQRHEATKMCHHVSRPSMMRQFAPQRHDEALVYRHAGSSSTCQTRLVAQCNKADALHSTPPPLPRMAAYIDKHFRTNWENFVDAKSVMPKIPQLRGVPSDYTHPSNYKSPALRTFLRQQGEDPNKFSSG